MFALMVESGFKPFGQTDHIRRDASIGLRGSECASLINQRPGALMIQHPGLMEQPFDLGLYPQQALVLLALFGNSLSGGVSGLKQRFVTDIERVLQ